MNIEQELRKILEEDFYKIGDIAFKELYDNNEEFIKLRGNINKLIEKYPSVNDVCCEGLSCELSKDEMDALIKYLKYKDRENELYEEKLLYSGVKVAYIIFKKAGMLKDE